MDKYIWNTESISILSHWIGSAGCQPTQSWQLLHTSEVQICATCVWYLAYRFHKFT